MPRSPDITDCLPQLQSAEQALHAYANETLGIEYSLAAYGALRDEADTIEIMGYRQDDYAAAIRANPAVANTPINTWRPIAPFGSSYHNYGAAFDVTITDAGGFDNEADALRALKNVAPSFGLRSTVPNDPPHFELPVSLSEARQLWINYSGNADVPDVPSGSSNVAALTTVAIVTALVFVIRKLRG